MGCVLARVCAEEDMRIMQDCAAGEDKDGRAEPAVSSSRRLSRSKTGLLLVDPVTVAIVAGEARASGAPGASTPADAKGAAIVYGGGVPGVALDAARVDLPEFTGARDGGYKSRNGRLRWGARSRAGNDPLRRRKENQDCLCVCDALAGDADATLFSVFDGHGPQGAFVSHFVREQYHVALADAYADLAHRRATAATAASKRASVSCGAAADVFKRVASAVSERLAASGIDTSVSGTTAVGMLVQGGDVVIANVGDSRAVVARYCDVERRFVPQCESADHKPDVPEERARIEASNGRVFEWGSCRVWLQDVDMPGLGMSRSFGDAVAKTVGVTADPDVLPIDSSLWSSGGKQTHASAFAVLASDGIWEFFSTDECVEFVSTCILQDDMSPQQACDALVDEAFERWNAEEDVVDDITVALVFF